MKINELKIGNYVWFKGKPTKVCGITENEIQVFETRDLKLMVSDKVILSEGNIDPILLTDTILEDNHFKSMEIDGFKQFVSKDFNLALTKETDLSYRYNHQITIKYVHQLQNLLSLIGFDIEILIKV